MISLRFLKSALMANFKLSMAWRIAFFVNILLVIVKQSLFLITWNFFFEKYELIQGWSFSDMLLMYGIVSFSIGFVELFFYGLRDLPRMVETNQLDTYLLQPKSLILNIAMSRGDMAAIGEILLGVMLIGYSGYLANSSFLVLTILPMGVVFIFSLYLYLSSIAFFIKNSNHFIRELYSNANIIATQPNSAYRGTFRLFTLTFLPTAYISFFPVEFIRTIAFNCLIIAYLGTLSFLLVAIWIFKKGLKRYESGSFSH